MNWLNVAIGTVFFSAGLALCRWALDLPRHRRRAPEGLHLMLDVETLGLGPTSALLQIGAVVFDMRTGREVDAFLVDIDPADCAKWGARPDEETAKWRQERGGWKPAGTQHPVAIAFSCLLDWLAPRSTTVTRIIPKNPDDFPWVKPPIVNVWACGTDFDIAILNWYARQLNTELPWQFWQVCDVRTVETLAKASGWQRPTGAATHRADEDCSRQIINLRSALAHLGH
jgi:hypothetical protein